MSFKTYPNIISGFCRAGRGGHLAQGSDTIALFTGKQAAAIIDAVCLDHAYADPAFFRKTRPFALRIIIHRVLSYPQFEAALYHVKRPQCARYSNARRVLAKGGCTNTVGASSIICAAVAPDRPADAANRRPNADPLRVINTVT